MKFNSGITLALMTLLATSSTLAQKTFNHESDVFRLEKTGEKEYQLSQIPDIECSETGRVVNDVGDVACLYSWKSWGKPVVLGMVDLIQEIPEGSTLNIVSDLYFAGRKRDGSCNDDYASYPNFNFVPITFKNDSITIRTPKEMPASYIYDACYEESGNLPVGFFSVLKGATVENIRFSNVSFTGNGVVGGVAARLENSTLSGVVVSSSKLVSTGKTSVGSGGALYVGAIAGSVNGVVSTDVVVMKASISIADDNDKNIYAGCLAGFMESDGYDLSLDAALVSGCDVKGSHLTYVGGLVGAVEGKTATGKFETHGVNVSTFSVEVKNDYTAIVGGAVGALMGNFSKVSLKETSIEEVSMNITANLGKVGGVIGSLDAKNIESTYVLNSIFVEKREKATSNFDALGKKNVVGYIIGSLDVDGKVDDKKLNVSGNICIAENSVYKNGIGDLGTFPGASTWEHGVVSGKTYIVKNYRNALEGESPTTTVAAEMSKMKGGSLNANGLLDVSEMNSNQFAFFINDTQNADKEKISAFLYVDENFGLTLGGVPLFSDSANYKRPHEISFDFGCVALGCLDLLETSTKDLVTKYLDSDLNLNETNGFVYLVYTNSDGKLANGDAAVLDSLVNKLGSSFSLVNGTGASFKSDVEYKADEKYVLKTDGFSVKYYVYWESQSGVPEVVPLEETELKKIGLNVYALQSDMPGFITSKNSNSVIPDFVGKTSDGSLSYLSPAGITEGVPTADLKTLISKTGVSTFDGLGLISSSSISVVYKKDEASKLQNRVHVFASDEVQFYDDTLQLQIQGIDFDGNALVFEKVSLTKTSDKKTTGLYPFMKIGKFPSGNASFGSKNTGWKVYFAVELSGDSDKLYQKLKNGTLISYVEDYGVRVKNLFENDARMELELDGLQFMDMNKVYLAVKKYLTQKNPISVDDAIYGLYFVPETENATYTVEFDVDEILNHDADARVFVSDNYINNETTVKEKFSSQKLSLQNQGVVAKFPSINEILVYRTDKCFDNLWGPTANYTGTAYDNFKDISKDAGFVKMLTSGATKPWEVTLYPHELSTKNCKKKLLAVDYTGVGKYGEVKLMKRVPWKGKNETIEYPFVWNNELAKFAMEIPVSGLDSIAYTFTVSVSVEDGYRLADNGLSFSANKINDDGSSEKVGIPLSDKGSFTLNEYGLEDMKIIAEFEKKPELNDPVKIVFDLGMERDSTKVFFVGADDFALSKVVDKANSGVEKLPIGIYTSDKCFDSWTYEVNGVQETLTPSDVIDSRNWDVIKNMTSTSKEIVLHAKWKDAASCSQSYNRWHLNAEHGSVRIVEEYFITKFEDFYHGFDTENEMLMPKNVTNRLSVSAVPEEGYTFESVDLIDVEGKVLASLKNNEQISASVVPLIKNLNAKFVKKKDIPDVPINPPDTLAPLEIVYQKLEFSGSVARLTISANKPASKLVEAEVTLLDDAGKVVNIRDGKFKLDGTNLYVYELSGLPMGENLLMSVTLTCKGESPVTIDYNFEVKYDVAEVEKNDWQMLSLAMMNLEEASWNDEDMAFFWWDESSSIGNFWQYRKLTGVADVDPARGYWYSSLEGRKMTVKRDVPEVGSVEWRLQHVHSGWNLVANPYSWYVKLQLQEEGVQVCRWNAKTGDYACGEGSFLLKPFEAVWVKVPVSRTMTLPVEPEFVSYIGENGETVMKAEALNDNAGQLQKSADGADWSVVASLADKSGRMDRWNVLGVANREVVSEEPPAGMGDHVNFSIVDGKRLLNKSFKKTSSANVYEWDVEMSATSARVGYLNFDGVERLTAHGLGLYVTIDGNTVQMKEGEPMPVSLNAKSKKASVRIAKTAPVTIAKRLDGLRAVHQNGGLLVQFNTTAALAGANAKVELVNLKGEVVARQTLKAAAGMNSLNLNVSKTGVYMLRVSVGSQKTAGKVVVR